MPKRILIFSIAYFPFVGGAEVAVREIAKRLPDYDFDLITARLKRQLPPQEQVDNIRVYRVGWGWIGDKYAFPILGLLKAKRMLLEGHYDAIWAIMANYAGLAALFLKWQHPKIPYLLTLQEGDAWSKIVRMTWWLWPLYKMIYKKADYIQAISRFLAERAKKMGARCPIEVVPNGVDIEKFNQNVILSPLRLRSGQAPGEESRANARANKWRDPSAPAIWRGPQDDTKEVIRIKDGKKVIITVSRLVKKNGIEVLIRAMKFLDNDVHLLIVGTGELENHLKNITAKENLEQRVHFLGHISHDNLPQFLWSSDIFCRPSLSEGLGNVFLEAMAAGLPIIGTPVGGIPDFLQDGETGLFCQISNPKSIAEKIKILLTDENLRQKLIVNGRKLVEENYHWDLIAKKMENIFENLQVKT